MYGKILILGHISLETGLHIGGSDAFAAIGAVDSPVIRDALTNQTMIPGSSLKGKMRSLLAKEYNQKLAVRPDDDDERILRLFGTSKKDHVRQSRILFPDMFLNNTEDLKRHGIQNFTEVKFENTINRATAVANPRQIERAVRGSVFDMELVYEVLPEIDEKEILEDMELLAEGMKLLEYDYLGGNGSRGYGKIKFKDVEAEAAVGDIPAELEQACSDIFKKARI